MLRDVLKHLNTENHPKANKTLDVKPTIFTRSLYKDIQHRQSDYKIKKIINLICIKVKQMFIVNKLQP